ncbi:unnamed protein product [Polarella glacialis]|uniref:Uncharacterized protein n=1 Tax=Polarella glacialis TaxID=89957 RepID=A0A813IB98_POLGL|nr:unnamed protein product [Polarella glacialis]
MEGELVEGEFVFVVKKGERRGGYVKVRNLRAAKENKVPEIRSDEAELAVLAQGLRRPPEQRWAVMDSVHDGAWLRREPSGSSSSQNVVCLVPNGTIVLGDFVHLRRTREPHEQGFVRFCDLHQQGPKAWAVRTASGAVTTILQSEPKVSEASGERKSATLLVQGEKVEGEFVFVSYKNGKHEGFIKRHYLTALELKSSEESLRPTSGATARTVS